MAALIIYTTKLMYRMNVIGGAFLVDDGVATGMSGWALVKQTHLDHLRVNAVD